MEDRLEKGLSDRFKVNSEEIREHFQTLLVKVVVKKLFWGLKNHLKNRFGCFFVDFLLDEKAQFFNGFLGVLFYEVFHVEGQNRVLDVNLGGKSIWG